MYKYDDLNLQVKPYFIKIDTEGYDHLVFGGIKKNNQKI